jgi:signal transduction histidine kinase/CHASE2 domain-containing sensor protein
MRWQHYLRQVWQGAEPLLPGGLASLVIVGLLKLGTWQPLEYLAYRTLFQIRGPVPWDQRVAVIAVDEASLKALGHFPWSRQKYTQLLNILTKADASTVVLDVLLPESSPDDPAFAAAIAQQGRVVLAQAWDSMGSPLLPNQILREASAIQGHIYQRQDQDGLTRKIEPQLRGVPALGLAATQVYSLVQEEVPLPNLKQPFWVNWLGPASQAPTYSYVDVIQGRVPAQTFQHKVILVGLTATGFDALQTPFDNNPPTTNVYLHAAVINNLLQQNTLNVLPENWLLVGLLVLGPSLSIVLPRWNVGWQMLGLGGLCLGWGLFSLLLFQANHWIPVASPIALFIFTTAAVALNEHFKANSLLQQEVDRLWQTYRQDLVLRTEETPTLAAEGACLLHQSIPLPQMPKLAALAEQFGRSQSAQAAIARSVSIGLVAADLKGLIWFCNPIATIYLQVRVGDQLHSQLVPEWLNDHQWQLKLAALRQHNPVMPWEIQRGDRWVELKLEPLGYHLNPSAKVDQRNPQASTVNLQDSQNLTFPLAQPNGLLLVLEDITNRKNVEKNLQQQMQELQQLSQMKDDFLSTVSHELRTPVTNMRMAIRLLQQASAVEQRSRYLQILEDECNREISLINDLLDLQRLEASARTIHPETIYLQDWLPQLIEPFYQRVQARQQTLHFQMAPNLFSLLADRATLERVLVELLNNACKYTPPTGKIEIRVDAVFSHINFRVSNSGTEIPEAELSKIFEKFYRASNSDRWQQGGTGLGLALVKKLVERLGGTIQVSSELGQTIFTVQIPVSAPKEQE